MKKKLFAAALFASIFSNAQAFTEGFEAPPPGGWTYINDGSSDPNEQWGYWMYYWEIVPYEGNYMAGIQFSTSATHNDYLVSPQFKVIAGVSDRISFYALNYSGNFQETLNVLISETTPDANQFSHALVSGLEPSSGTWTKYEYDLTPYIGKQIYIAFHSNSYSKWFLGIDNVAVFGNTMATSENAKENVSLYPNPFKDILNISDVKDVKSISIKDISGKLIRTFPADKQIDLTALKPGLYLAILQMNDGSLKTYKTIKK